MKASTADLQMKTKQLVALGNVAFYHWFRYGPYLVADGRHVDAAEAMEAANEAYMYLEECMRSLLLSFYVHLLPSTIPHHSLPFSYISFLILVVFTLHVFLLTNSNPIH